MGLRGIRCKYIVVRWMMELKCMLEKDVKVIMGPVECMHGKA